MYDAICRHGMGSHKKKKGHLTRPFGTVHTGSARQHHSRACLPTGHPEAKENKRQPAVGGSPRRFNSPVGTTCPVVLLDEEPNPLLFSSPSLSLSVSLFSLVPLQSFGSQNIGSRIIAILFSLQTTRDVFKQRLADNLVKQIAPKLCSASLTLKITQSTDLMRTPPGISLLRRLRGQDWSFSSYRYTILLITFIAYTCYHASRKPSSIVKSVLDPQPGKSVNLYTWPIGNIFVKADLSCSNTTILRNEGWAPFNGKDGTSKLGEIDLAFLACYSMGMYFAGHLGDTLDLRLFLSIGMIGSGMFVAFFGMGYFLDIHVFWFYLLMQMVAGLFQATGWPSVVAVVGNWFGKRKRGLIMGIWNAHTSVGNITGSLLAASVLQYGWGWSFIVPGAFICMGGLLVYLFLAAYPEDVGFPNPYDLAANSASKPRDEEALRQNGNGVTSAKRGVGLLEACLIPGVIPFAFCLFFAKLVAYTFLYWLPFYLSQTEVGGEHLSVKSAGNLSTLFDVGGIIGGILAGYISDKLNARAITAASFMYAAIPSMLLYRTYGNISMPVNIALMMMAGLFVNGPYALITTAVSADLGTHSSLKGDSRALATVTAIIDGTGSAGAALGPLLTGFLSTKGWDAVFLMLMGGALVAGLLLSRLVISEISEMTQRKSSSGAQQSIGGPSEPLLHGEK